MTNFEAERNVRHLAFGFCHLAFLADIPIATPIEFINIQF